jgi:hypothetical protein
LTGADAEGSTIPEAVPIEGVVPEIQEAAPATAEEKRNEVLPDSSLEVVVR